MSRMDDKLQWRVENVSRKVWEAGLLKAGDHVIIAAGQEHAYEFTDGIVVTDAKHIVAKVSTGGFQSYVQECADGGHREIASGIRA